MILAKIPIDLIALEATRGELSLPHGDHASDYMVHAALKEAFDSDLLTYWIDPQTVGTSQHVLAYLEQVRWDELGHDAIITDGIQTRDVPISAIATADVVRIELEVSPVRRGDRGERDVFLTHLDWAKANGEKKDVASIERGEVYTQWLAERLKQRGVKVEPGGIEYAGFKLETILRRTRASKKHPRKSTSIKQPVARFFVRGSFEGDLETVKTFIRRGVGRHRQYGRGMPRFSTVR